MKQTQTKHVRLKVASSPAVAAVAAVAAAAVAVATAVARVAAIARVATVAALVIPAASWKRQGCDNLTFLNIMNIILCQAKKDLGW